MDFKDKIKNRRLELGLTQEDLAKAIGVTTPTIGRYESGEIKNVRRDKVANLAKALDLTPAYLMGWTSEPINNIKSRDVDSVHPSRGGTHMVAESSTAYITSPSKSHHYVDIPVYGSVACGYPLEAYNEIIDYATIPIEWTRGGLEYLCLTAAGDSMAPLIEDGDLAVIRLQPTAENGQICAVYVNGYDATLKKYYRNGNIVTLQPLNTMHQPQVFAGKEAADINILGIMVELRKRFI